jgi:hypothetical protein
MQCPDGLKQRVDGSCECKDPRKYNDDGYNCVCKDPFILVLSTSADDLMPHTNDLLVLSVVADDAH